MARRKREETAISRIPDGQAKVIQKVFDSIDRTEIVQALLDSGDPRAVSLAERLNDGAYDRTQLAKHCFDLKLLPKDVWNILIDTRRLETRLRISEGLVSVAAAVMEAAVPQTVECPRCQGTGKNSKGETCPVTIVRDADKDAQKMALEMGEMLNQKVPLIAQQFNKYGPSGGTDGGWSAPDMTEWTRSTDAVFEGARTNVTVIDAEVIEK